MDASSLLQSYQIMQYTKDMHSTLLSNPIESQRKHIYSETLHQLLEDYHLASWNDFNSHDPGVTTLEQICWALTDLGYRLDHPIPDLLAEDGSNAAHSLTPPREALNCAPVTLHDLRRLLLDIDGVNNVWIEADHDSGPQLFYHPERHTLGTQALAAETQPLQLRGLWKVKITSDDVTNPPLKREVIQRLFLHRPLCQDFTDITILPSEPIVVQADIEIGPMADAEGLIAQILHAIAEHISPSVAFRSRREQQAAGHALEDLHDGPALQHGVIDDDDLPDAHQPDSLRTSDLIRVIMDVPGVQAVRHIRLAKSGSDSWDEWVLDLESDKAPRLDAKPELIRLYREQSPLRLDPARIWDRYNKHRESDTRRPVDTTDPPPRGRNRNISRYHSILHHFPEVYGVGPAGLPPRSTPQRRAQMKQFKAYLQLFDQLLADHFAQAAHAARLLSSDNAPADQAYVAGVIEPDGLGLDEVRVNPDRYQGAVEAIAENESNTAASTALRRRQLDHLLARFGETFIDPLDSSADWDGLRERHALLAEIASSGAARGSAVNSLEPLGEDNRGGLERRLALKLGLHDDEDFLLLEHILLRAETGDQSQSLPLLQQVGEPDPYSLQISLVFPQMRGRFASSSFRAFVENTVRAETPAHLRVYVHWLADDKFAAFSDAFQHWHAVRRATLREHFGLPD